MEKIKKVAVSGGTFNPQKEDISSRDYYKMKFKLKDVLPMVKLIYFECDNFKDGGNTILSYYVNEQYPTKPIDVNGDIYKIEAISSRAEIGWIVLKNGEPVYLVGIYEPHGESINAKRGVATFWGHEEIINLWLDDGEASKIHTR